MKIIEHDIVFISYDEPNADLNYADLLTKAPWAKRIHGVKGSDAAHKAAAELSDTDWLITVDGDNIVDNNFFDLDLDMADPKILVYGWCGINSVNNLRYGNGGLKIWNKDFIRNMKTHEAAESDQAQVDFCWEDGYRNHPRTYSRSIINTTPYQAWRAGFREGVKMTLHNGVKVPSQEIKQRVWWHNLHRLKIWSTIGAHVENGLYAVYGARLGTWLTNCTDWNYVEVRDFEILKGIWDQYGLPYQEANNEGLEDAIKELGEKIKYGLGFDYLNFDKNQSKYVSDVYDETINLCATYYYPNV